MQTEEAAPNALTSLRHQSSVIHVSADNTFVKVTFNSDSLVKAYDISFSKV